MLRTELFRLIQGGPHIGGNIKASERFMAKTLAGREAEAKERKKKSNQKKTQQAAAAAGPKATKSIADVRGSWDTPSLVEKLDEIESACSSKKQEHLQVVKLAEYLEEQFTGVACDWSADLQLSGVYTLSPEALAAPLSSLPNKSVEAIVKWLRR